VILRNFCKKEFIAGVRTVKTNRKVIDRRNSERALLKLAEIIGFVLQVALKISEVGRTHRGSDLLRSVPVAKHQWLLLLWQLLPTHCTQFHYEKTKISLDKMEVYIKNCIFCSSKYRVFVMLIISALINLLLNLFKSIYELNYRSFRMFPIFKFKF